MTDLKQQSCKPCEGGVDPLTPEKAKQYLQQVNPRWSCNDNHTMIKADFEFKDYYETTAFINGTIWMSHQEDHHPDITFGYNKVTIQYTTHAIDGLSENDFICAAKIDALLS